MPESASPSSSPRLNPELRNRVVYGAAAGAVTLFVLFALGSWATFFVALALGLQGWREYARMMKLDARPAFLVLGYVVLFMMFIYSFFNKPADMGWIWTIWVLGFFLLYFENIFYDKLKRPLVTPDAQADWTVLCRFILGIIYIFFIFGYIGPVVSKDGMSANKTYGEQLLFLALLVVFSGDIAAYFGGKRWGSRKLWPSLSPNKTVEGALSGALASIVAGVASYGFFLLFFSKPLPLKLCLSVGILTPALAQAADFLESLMKRAAGTKDSGDFLPGHGGILDRVDGLAFVLPLLYYLF